jgi:hypothetical protein
MPHIGSLRLSTNLFRGILEGFKACHKDMSKDEKTLGTFVIIVESPQNASSHELT